MRIVPLLLATTITTAPVLLYGKTFQHSMVAYVVGDYETAAENFLTLAVEGSFSLVSPRCDVLRIQRRPSGLLRSG